MPAESWRTIPARSKSLCETTSASAGSSRRVGTKYWDQRIVFCQLNFEKSVKAHSRLAPAAKANQTLRLCRPMRKGFAFPFTCHIGFGGYASKLSRGVALHYLKRMATGKAKPYRTSGGKAANALLVRVVCRVHNA